MQISSTPSTQTLKTANRLQQLLPDVFNPKTVGGEQFLRVQLTPDLTIALALSWVEESLLIPTQLVTPMPNMPSSVLGLMSSKDQVFWAINLAQLLELPIVLEPSQSYEVVVIRALPTDSNIERLDASTDEELYLGLVVPKIRSSVRLLQEDIISPVDEVDASFHPYLSGQVVIDDEVILVLSAEAIGAARSLTSVEF
ncbi:chemotaxis signal transduction protein [Leptolyngbya sp. Heron Island J]|uniref:chemotaxis protein CheW n=1 Tax=Leptolyngbya sp. Heron Island J TaxID=1385935 RepID=UPI0003B9CEB6|nr:chemotaxis protein CheW [Leptolyngbya sp. Heron Island J]ESA36484.1 chemotaxis signal transduction protein [Leptolyngbya sp. Heron Island J]